MTDVDTTEEAAPEEEAPLTEVSVEEYKSIPKTVHAVEYDGTMDQAHLLIQHKWLDGCAMGYDRDGGTEVLRGLVGAAIVYPGDLIIHHKAKDKDTPEEVEVMDGETFDEHYKETGKSEKLEGDTTHRYAGGDVAEDTTPLGVEAITTQDVNPPPDELVAMQQIPSGENPDAVNLEPDTQPDPQAVDEEPGEETAE